MKKLLTFLILTVSIAMLFSFSALAEIYSGNCGKNGDNVTYTLDTTTGELIISGSGEMEDYWDFDGAPWYSDRSSVKTVTISDGVTSIGKYAFYGCSNLTSITMPEKVTSIGDRGFSSCRSLTSIVIPDGVTSVGYETFSNCSKLISITIPDSVTSIAQYAFYNCESLTSITVPDSVTSIDSFAFSGCSNLESITLPFVGISVKTSSDTYQYPFGIIFGTKSYYGSTATWQSYYGNSTSSTTSSQFYIPTSLKEVTITGGNILRGAFDNCSNITNITIGDGVTSIGRLAFYKCYDLTSITIPDSVTSIGIDAFYGCNSLFILCNNTSYVATYSKNNNIKAHYYQHTVTKMSTTVTCVADGVTEYDCNDCAYTYSIFETALGHDYIYHSAKAETCTEIGWDAYETCSCCDYTSYVEIPALGHDVKNCEAKATDCTEVGWDAYEACTRCDYSTYVEIPALGHDLVEGEATDDGMYYNCTRCDYSKFLSNKIIGDSDGDGNVTIRDAARILQYKADWDVEIDLDASDVDGDGSVTIRDAARILQYKAGWDVTVGTN